MEQELFIPINGYPNYEISTHGRVYSHNYNRILKGSLRSNKKYYFVQLCHNGETKKIDIHRLVALNFIGDCPDGYVVDHIDENTFNNHYSNLHYITHGDNISKAHLGKSKPLSQVLKMAKSKTHPDSLVVKEWIHDSGEAFIGTGFDLGLKYNLPSTNKIKLVIRGQRNHTYGWRLK